MSIPSLKDIADFLSKTVLFPLSISIVYILYKVLPDSFLKVIGLTNIPIGYEFWLNLLGVICIIYTLLYFIAKPVTYYFEQYKLKRKVKHIKETIKNQLTRDEKDLLKKYIDQDTRSLNLNYADGTVSHLANLGIIYRASQVSRMHTYFDYAIQDFALDYLKKNPHLLD